MGSRGTADDDPGLPLKLWPCSNGEYLPPPLDDLRAEAMRRARAEADHHARRHGWSRRRFLLSSAGMTAGLVALQACSDDRSRSQGTRPGGTFDVPPTAATDPEQATTIVHGTETSTTTPESTVPTAPSGFVVDVQTHFLESGGWGVDFPQGACGEAEPIDCFSAEYWRDLVLTQSDTAVAVISAVPVVGEADPLSIDAMERGKALAAELCGDGRVLIQGHAVPDVGPLDAALASMAEVAAGHDLCAWKVYTHAPTGWALDDEAIGAPFLQAVRDTGVPRRRRAQGAVGRQPMGLAGRHRPGGGGQPGPAFPRVPLGLRVRGHRAGRTTPPGAGSTASSDRSADAGIGTGGNVYAELGSTWRTVMGSPDEAAHVLGKLLTAFGPERILWGTDSIWYGSPQDQIAAFRAFEISPEFQERFGYPALTPAVKDRILGANAAELFGITPPPGTCGPPPAGVRSSNRTYGPRSRRDVLDVFQREHPWTVDRSR